MSAELIWHFKKTSHRCSHRDGRMTKKYWQLSIWCVRAFLSRDVFDVEDRIDFAEELFGGLFKVFNGLFCRFPESAALFVIQQISIILSARSAFHYVFVSDSFHCLCPPLDFSSHKSRCFMLQNGFFRITFA